MKKVDLNEGQNLRFVFFIKKNTIMTVSENIIRLWEISDDLNVNLKASKFLPNISNIGVI